jgi:hypothetical protein
MQGLIAPRLNFRERPHLLDALRMFASAGIFRRQLFAIGHEFQHKSAFRLVEYAFRNLPNLVRPTSKFRDGIFILHIRHGPCSSWIALVRNYMAISLR